MQGIIITLAAALLIAATPEVTCEAVMQQDAQGIWTFQGCLGGCEEQDPCLETTLSSSSGSDWTTCLCNGNWVEQICSAVLQEGPSGPPDVHCLRGGCADCAEGYYSNPEGDPRMECYCQ